MKRRIAMVLALATAPVFFAAAAQSDSSKEAAPQASHENLSSNTNRATSHDRHMRKHRSGSRRHRPRTASKTNPHPQ
jgi:Ni/Co efflux regulator RcnB